MCNSLHNNKRKADIPATLLSQHKHRGSAHHRGREKKGNFSAFFLFSDRQEARSVRNMILRLSPGIKKRVIKLECKCNKAAFRTMRQTETRCCSGQKSGKKGSQSRTYITNCRIHDPETTRRDASPRNRRPHVGCGKGGRHIRPLTHTHDHWTYTYDH